MTYPQLGVVPYDKELNVLAMKVAQKDIEERFIRFQSLNFLQEKAKLDSIALRRLSYLNQTKTLDQAAFLQSQEMTDLYFHIRQSFSWKPGTYRVTVTLDSPDPFSILDDVYSFSLTPLQVQDVASNLELLNHYYANETFPRSPEQKKPEDVPWRWVYPEMQLIDG